MHFLPRDNPATYRARICFRPLPHLCPGTVPLLLRPHDVSRLLGMESSVTLHRVQIFTTDSRHGAKTEKKR